MRMQVNSKVASVNRIIGVANGIVVVAVVAAVVSDKLPKFADTQTLTTIVGVGVAVAVVNLIVSVFHPAKVSTTSLPGVTAN